MNENDADEFAALVTGTDADIRQQLDLLLSDEKGRALLAEMDQLDPTHSGRFPKTFKSYAFAFRLAAHVLALQKKQQQ